MQLRDMNINDIEQLFKTTSKQFTFDQHLKRFYYLFKLKFKNYDQIQNNANNAQQKWFK